MKGYTMTDNRNDDLDFREVNEDGDAIFRGLGRVKGTNRGL